MTDTLETLKQALRDTPAPRRTARDTAVSAALAAFDEEFRLTAQENGPAGQASNAPARPRVGAASWLGQLIGRRPMSLFATPLRVTLAGGASLAAVALVAAVTLVQLPPDTRNLAVPAPSVPSARLHDASQDDTHGPGRRGETESAEQDLVASPAAPRPRPAASVPAKQSGGGVLGNFSQAEPHPGQPAPRSQLAFQEGQDLRPTDYRDQGHDRFAAIDANPVKVTRASPVSTFSVDVDTASYGFLRAALMSGVLPQGNAIRVEELINYFSYDYPLPADRAEPFAASLAVLPTPWNDDTKLLHIGIKGYDLPAGARPRANLVFLVDTSGSMRAANKLPLLINGFKLLLERLEPDDRVAIVTYAGNAGTVLEPTPAGERTRILAALEQLRAGGSTAGAEGLRQAYLLAERHRLEDGVNRVILATDGDFNVGITDLEELKSFVARKRETGVALSVLGFGRGNLNDTLMQALAQNGNGNAAYIDTLNEARKVLVEQVAGTLFTIAKDVKLQVEFNPETVAEYRLIGYETRVLRREDFNNDRADAGEIGAGHSVTALYEITPVGSKARLVDDLRYDSARSRPTGAADEYGFLKIRYKQPDADLSRLIELPITRDQELDSVGQATADVRFAAAVAAFGQILRGGRYTGSYGYDEVEALAQSAKGNDRFGYRAEFLGLVRLARSAAALAPRQP